MIRVSSPFDIVRLILTTSARQSRTNMTRVNGKRMTSRLPRKAALTLACASLAGVTLAQQAEREEGIPVNDPLVIAKCGSCHTRDERGNMQRISWERTTPEGWQEALRQMILADGVQLTPPEADQTPPPRDTQFHSRRSESLFHTHPSPAAFPARES